MEKQELNDTIRELTYKLNGVNDDLTQHKQSLKTELSKNERISSEISK